MRLEKQQIEASEESVHKFLVEKWHKEKEKFKPGTDGLLAISKRL